MDDRIKNLSLTIGLFVMFAAVCLFASRATPTINVSTPAVNVAPAPVTVNVPAGQSSESKGSDGILGGLIHNTQESFDEGIAVDGTEVINNDGSKLTMNDYARLVSSGSFNDATNTLACVLNPFSATSTAVSTAYQVTGVPTTSVAIVVATSTQTTGLSTSTPGFTSAGPSQLMHVNLMPRTTATNTRYYGGIVTDIRSGQSRSTVTRVSVGPSESVCFVAGEGDGGSTLGVTNAVNLFAGIYKIIWEK